MAKLTAWLVTLIGVLLVLKELASYEVPYTMAIVALAVLVVGIGKLVRNYSVKKK